jgi:hypothetical protein
LNPDPAKQYSKILADLQIPGLLTSRKVATVVEGVSAQNFHAVVLPTT